MREEFDAMTTKGASRRDVMRGAGLLGAGSVSAGSEVFRPAHIPRQAAAVSYDDTVLNFVLNLEYLGAAFYLAALGLPPLPSQLTVGGRGQTSGGMTLPSVTKVPFENAAIFAFAEQLAVDEYAHVAAIREILGHKSIAQPALDLDLSWTNLAVAAGLIAPGQIFTPFASEADFLIGAYVLEDVCVTALCGAASLITSKSNLAYVASILGAESYQVGMIRQLLSSLGGGIATDAISALRSGLANEVASVGVDDFGTDANDNAFNFTDNDVNGQAFRRSPTQILAIVYGTTTNPGGQTAATGGGFFPNGVNGAIYTT